MILSKKNITVIILGILSVAVWFVLFFVVMELRGFPLFVLMIFSTFLLVIFPVLHEKIGMDGDIIKLKKRNKKVDDILFKDK